MLLVHIEICLYQYHFRAEELKGPPIPSTTTSLPTNTTFGNTVNPTMSLGARVSTQGLDQEQLKTNISSSAKYTDEEIQVLRFDNCSYY